MFNNNYPPLYESCRDESMIKMPNSNYSDMLIASGDSSKTAIYMGDGWCTFPDLDNFDSEKLLKAFTLKVKQFKNIVQRLNKSY